MPTKKTNSFRLFEQAKETYNPRVGTLSEQLIRLRQKNIAESLSDFEGSAHKLEHSSTMHVPPPPMPSGIRCNP